MEEGVTGAIEFVGLESGQFLGELSVDRVYRHSFFLGRGVCLGLARQVHQLNSLFVVLQKNNRIGFVPDSHRDRFLLIFLGAVGKEIRNIEALLVYFLLLRKFQYLRIVLLEVLQRLRHGVLERVIRRAVPLPGVYAHDLLEYLLQALVPVVYVRNPDLEELEDTFAPLPRGLFLNGRKLLAHLNAAFEVPAVELKQLPAGDFRLVLRPAQNLHDLACSVCRLALVC